MNMIDPKSLERDAGGRPVSHFPHPALIFGNNRGRKPTIELIAEANLGLTLGKVLLRIKREAREEGGANGIGIIGVIAELGKAVFRAQRPIVGERIFKTAAGGPANTRVRKARSASRDAGKGPDRVNKLVFDAGESNAAGAVEQDGFPANADAGADRSLQVGLRCRRDSAGAAEAGEGRHDGFAEASAVNRTFNADHPLVELLIVPNVRAADHTLRAIVERLREVNKRRLNHPRGLVIAPSVADLAAHIYAGPSKNRNGRRRRID